MKTTALFIGMLLSTVAHAESAWQQTGIQKERYEHRFEERKSKRHADSDKQVKESHRGHKQPEQKTAKVHIEHHRHDKKDHRHSDRHRDYRFKPHNDRRYGQSHHRPDERRHDHRQDRRYKSDKRHHRDHSYRPRPWQVVSAFRGRTGKDVTRYIGVDDRVHALSVTGLKRAMYIRRAYALLGNGEWIRIRGLEGYVNHGESVRHRLRHARYVRQVALDIEPARHKRGYAELKVRPA